MDSHDDYFAMLGRIECDITQIDQATANASIAVSLRRIADVMERFEAYVDPAAIFDVLMSVQAMVEAYKANINQDARP